MKIHNLYVGVVSAGDVNNPSRAATLKVLQFVDSRMTSLLQMGIKIHVYGIRARDLNNSKLISSMRERGITQLPALTVNKNVYIGVDKITNLYDRNITKFVGNAAAQLSPSDSAMEDYYRAEISKKDTAEESDEDGMGEGGDMMASYSRRMASRNKKHESELSTSGRLSVPHGGGENSDVDADSIDPDTDAMRGTLSRLAQSSGRPDAESAQDDLMERAFYAN
jgi:hypothetical protein